MILYKHTYVHFIAKGSKRTGRQEASRKVRWQTKKIVKNGTRSKGMVWVEGEAIALVILGRSVLDKEEEKSAE